MSDATPSQTSWLYEGVWGVLTSVFCVPRMAPALPTIDREDIVYPTSGSSPAVNPSSSRSSSTVPRVGVRKRAAFVSRTASRLNLRS